MAIWEDLFAFISQETLFGLPTSLFMTAPFFIGLILGFLTKKALRIAVIALIAVGAGLYFGIFTTDKLKSYLDTLAAQYGPEAFHYAAILIGMLPLGVGLAVGLIIGLKYG